MPVFSTTSKFLKASRPSKRHLVSLNLSADTLIDGSTFAVTTLNIEGAGLTTFGDRINDYEHLRNLNLSKNRFENIDKVRALRHMQTLNASDNEIIDNYFMSESK